MADIEDADSAVAEEATARFRFSSFQPQAFPALADFTSLGEEYFIVTVVSMPECLGADAAYYHCRYA